MVRLQISPYQGTNQGEVIALGEASEAKFKFIGELDGNKAMKGAVFQIVSPTEKLLIWNGAVNDTGLEKFFQESELQDKLFRKIQGTKVDGLARMISSSDRFVFTNSDVVSVGGDVFSFEGLLTIRDDKREVLSITGRMIVQGNNVSEVSEVEINKEYKD